MVGKKIAGVFFRVQSKDLLKLFKKSRSLSAKSFRILPTGRPSPRGSAFFIPNLSWQQKISCHALGQIPVLTPFCRTYLLVNPWQERASCRD